jgi:hypothetical protein
MLTAQAKPAALAREADRCEPTASAAGPSTCHCSPPAVSRSEVSQAVVIATELSRDASGIGSEASTSSGGGFSLAATAALSFSPNAPSASTPSSSTCLTACQTDLQPTRSTTVTSRGGANLRLGARLLTLRHRLGLGGRGAANDHRFRCVDQSLAKQALQRTRAGQLSVSMPTRGFKCCLRVVHQQVPAIWQRRRPAACPDRPARLRMRLYDVPQAQPL